MLDRLHRDEHYSHVTPVSGIDWDLISNIDPKMISDKNTRKMCNKFLKNISTYTLTQKDREIFSHPLSMRYFLITQTLIDLLLEEKFDLVEKINNLNEENSFLRHELKKSKIDCENSEKRMRLTQDFVACPTCKKRFQNMEFLDLHIEKYHSNLKDYWQRLRNNELYTKTDIEIAALNDEIYHLNRKLEEQQNYINQLKTPIYTKKPKEKPHKQNVTISAVAIQPKHPPTISKETEKPINASKMIKELYPSDSEESISTTNDSEYDRIRKHIELSLTKSFPIPETIDKKKKKHESTYSDSTTSENVSQIRIKNNNSDKLSMHKHKKNKIIFESVSEYSEKSQSRNSPVQIKNDSEAVSDDPFIVESSVHEVSSVFSDSKKDRFISESLS